MGGSPNVSPSIDAAITIFSHEIQDMLTDPRNNAWIIQQDNTVVELGDFCAGSGVSAEQWFGNVQQVASKNASYNIEVGSQQFLVQTIFSKSKQQCVLSDN